MKIRCEGCQQDLEVPSDANGDIFECPN